MNRARPTLNGLELDDRTPRLEDHLYPDIIVLPARDDAMITQGRDDPLKDGPDSLGTAGQSIRDAILDNDDVDIPEHHRTTSQGRVSCAFEHAS